jgi:outer membrane receptor protein involved in Fe transport
MQSPADRLFLRVYEADAGPKRALGNNGARDKSYSDITNVNSIPAFVVANAMFSHEEPTWGISLNVNNFTNQRYYVAANAAGAFVGEPLTAFIKVYVKQ